MNLHSQGLNVVSTIGSAGEVAQVELNLIPTLIKSHGHGADERLHSGRALVVRSAESASNVLVIEDLHFKGEVLFELYNEVYKHTNLHLHSL